MRALTKITCFLSGFAIPVLIQLARDYESIGHGLNPLLAGLGVGVLLCAVAATLFINDN